ncbi:glucose-6-phosphate dehydrogenase [Cellulomonas fimi]|uniref:Glucose-6-phosphate 1-dehydrogenase n=2 Tax=Cellulomonas fimi TaxID=1708 RepID=A0A7Y0QHU0_CELFI|nr:glucose-6-phosphate dehydrogenase [Cellulomonas fimi]
MVMPALVELHERGLLPERWRLVGCATDRWDDEAFRARLEDSLLSSEQGLPEDWTEVARRVRYAGGGFTEDDPGALPEVLARTHRELNDEGDGEPLVVHFLAVPPAAYPAITRGLGRHGLTAGARVVYEKPYGTSLADFEALDALVKEVLTEEQVFRIDHFLGKQAVQAIYALRFANRLFGSQWDARAVEQVQIDVPEDLDVAQRAGFYDATGAALDMLVTHLFHVASQVAMDPPWNVDDPDAIVAARDAVMTAFRPLDPATDVVLGQFEGYTDIAGVAAGSTQDTFVAARLWIDTDRWRGVPFVLRTGKRMARKAQRITLVMRPPEGPLADAVAEPNTVEIDFSGSGAVAVGVTVNTPGPAPALAYAHTELDLADVPGGEPISAYASLLHDVLAGDRSLFTTSHCLRSSFTAFAPLQGPGRPAPLSYAPGSWGPGEAERLAAPHGWVLERRRG